MFPLHPLSFFISRFSLFRDIDHLPDLFFGSRFNGYIFHLFCCYTENLYVAILIIDLEIFEYFISFLSHLADWKFEKKLGPYQLNNYQQ